MEWKREAREYVMLTIGTVITAAGSYFFKFPNHFSTGGVTGMAVIFSAIFPGISNSSFTTIINLLFLILGFLVLSKSFGIRTVYCTILFSAVLQLFDVLFPMSAPLTDDTLMELFYGVALPAFGAGILFNLDGSTGGTDILAMILKKYTSLDIGTALMYVDFIVAASTFFFYGIKVGLYSMLGLILKTALVDNVIESLNRKKCFMTITKHPNEVCDYILHTLNRSATFWEAEGAYSQTERWVVLTCLTRGQAVKLRRHLKLSDPEAFMLVTNSSEIFGKGFLHVT